MIITPTNPTTTAIHCPRVTRSCNSGTDNAVTSNGARKLTAVASACGMNIRLLVNSRLVPSKARARKTCRPGRLVRNTRNPADGMKMQAINSVCTR
ncbi:hypothetical protein IBA8401_04920 [Pseudomonas syringae]